MKTIVRTSLLALLFCVAPLAQLAQSNAPISPSKVSTEELDSKLMGRKMPYEIIRPDNYFDKSETGRRYPVLYLLHGLMGHFENWTSRTQVVSYSAGLNVIIVAVEGDDGWYTDNLIKDGEKYESYIIKELIPEIDKRYRTLDRRDHRGVAGLSMGGYGAIKFGLKYPGMFSVAGSFSGVIGAATMTEKEIPGVVGRAINTTFGPFGGEIRKANDPFDIVRRASPDKIKGFPFLYLDCGTEDVFLQTNRDFAALLLEKKVPHEFRQLPGGHNWQYWDSQLHEFLRVADRFLNFKG